MTRTRTLLLPVGAAALALTLVACSGSSAGSSVAGPTTDEVSGSFAEPEVTAFLGFDRSGQEAELRTRSASLEQQLLALAGLDAALGSPEKAGTAYAEVSSKIVGGITSKLPTLDFGPLGSHVRQADAPSLGGLMFGGMMVVALGAEGAVTATNDLPAPTSGSLGEGDGASIDVAGGTNSAVLDTTFEETAGGVTGKLKTHIDIAPCPDAEGKFSAEVTMEMSVTQSAGSAGWQITMAFEMTGTVNDDAELAGHEMEANTQASSTSAGSSSFVDVSQSTAWTGDSVTAASSTVNRTGDSTPAQFVSDWSATQSMMSAYVEHYVLDAAAKGWKSGRCVKIDVTTDPGKRTGLQPSTVVAVTAAPRSKLDGAATGGTVTATLAGDTSIDPSGTKVPADAAFTYTAPGEKNKSASVALEARSRRGVGKADVTFDTRPGAYKVTGTIATAPSGTPVTGTICQPDKPFTLTSTGDMVGTIRFTPKDETSGTLTFKGKVGNAPFRLTGSGTYTIDIPADSDTGTLNINWKVTIRIPSVGSRTNSGKPTLTLTPTASCGS